MAGYRATGIVTRPKLMAPFQRLLIPKMVRMKSPLRLDSGVGSPVSISFYRFLLGSFLRLVFAKSSSCFSDIDLAICLDAPRRDDFFCLPRFAASAAPAAICCFLDRAGMCYMEVPGVPTGEGRGVGEVLSGLLDGPPPRWLLRISLRSSHATRNVAKPRARRSRFITSWEIVKSDGCSSGNR